MTQASAVAKMGNFRVILARKYGNIAQAKAVLQYKKHVWLYRVKGFGMNTVLMKLLKPKQTYSGDYTPVLLAPMAGITDSAFRRLCIAKGCDFTFTEMVSAKGIHYNNKKTQELISVSPQERPCGVQLFGHEPEIVAETARRVYDSYGDDIGVIDINMGCPAPKITGNGDGSALMRNPPLAGRIIEATARSVPIPVSVKFRMGWDESTVNAVEFSHIAEESGTAFMTIHGRTRMQMYSGTADWDIIAECVQAVGVPVIGNGDVFSGEAALRLKAHTGCAGIMAARGAQGNPFLFAEIRAALDGKQYIPPTETERLDAALMHIREYLAVHSAGAFVELRKHVAWYTKGMYGGAELRRRVNGCSDATELIKMVEDFQVAIEEIASRGGIVPEPSDG